MSFLNSIKYVIYYLKFLQLRLKCSVYMHRLQYSRDCMTWIVLVNQRLSYF